MAIYKCMLALRFLPRYQLGWPQMVAVSSCQQLPAGILLIATMLLCFIVTAWPLCHHHLAKAFSVLLAGFRCPDQARLHASQEQQQWHESSVRLTGLQIRHSPAYKPLLR